jgi:hypothetical protein
MVLFSIKQNILNGGRIDVRRGALGALKRCANSGNSNSASDL